MDDHSVFLPYGCDFGIIQGAGIPWLSAAFRIKCRIIQDDFEAVLPFVAGCDDCVKFLSSIISIFVLLVRGKKKRRQRGLPSLALKYLPDQRE